MATKKSKSNNNGGVLVIISLTIALFLIAICGLLTIQAKKIATLVRQNMEVQVYLSNDLSAHGIDSVYKVLTKKNYISLKDDQFAQIVFVSKETAAQKFIAQTGEDFSKILGKENPLRNAYTIKLKEGFYTEDALKAIKQDLEHINGVHEADYMHDFIDDVNRNISKIYLILSVLAGLLLLILVLMVNNTVRLALYSQRFTIRSMQLVGATNQFIRKPFLGKSIAQGLVAGLLASSLLYILLQLAIQEVPELAQLQDIEKIIYLSIAVLTFGILIAFLSTFIALERYLRMSLDDLY